VPFVGGGQIGYLDPVTYMSQAIADWRLQTGDCRRLQTIADKSRTNGLTTLYIHRRNAR
jgi:hypothetical protein